MVVKFLLLLAIWVIMAATFAGDSRHPNDPHYTPSGFFDVHVCVWPDRPAFYMLLFSTEHYADIESVKVTGADGTSIGEFDLSEYKTLQHEKKSTERVFIKHIPVPDKHEDGWFVAEVNTKDGQQHTARDMVIHRLLPQVTGLYPDAWHENVPLPRTLRWFDVDGAYWYRVFIRDLWDDGKLIYSSRLLPYPDHELPAGLLRPGGYYSWKVHARDANGHPELGEFNSGSQSLWTQFSVADD